MTGQTITTVMLAAFGVAMVTTLVSRDTTKGVIEASGKAASGLVLATLGIK